MYYLGLDMGTNSVGWAVTDEYYKLLRAKGKDLWGIREFEEASTSVERRTNRIKRRRRQREVARLGWIKSFFDEAVTKEDSLFFVRLENSKYFLEDKNPLLKNRNCLFDDKDYKDKDYFKEFPTIFHLRKALIEDKIPYNERYTRLVYLAIENMFKHRGHFLDAGISDATNTDGGLSVAYGKLVESIKTVSEDVKISLPESVDYGKMESILASRDSSKTKKIEELRELLGIDKKDKITMECLKGICGRKVDGKKIFSLEELEEKADIDFSGASFEDNCESLHQILGDDYYEIVASMKEIYEIGILSGLLGEYSYLSEARVASYESHKSDLKLLKKVMKKFNSQEEYDKMFRSEFVGTYSAYVKSLNSDDKKARRSVNEKGRSKAVLYATIKELAKNWDEDDQDVKKIMMGLERENFLPKQLTAENGVIPNQVHKRELKKILDNAEKYLGFLLEKDETGLTVSERIVMLFEFHIPYYIGPLTTRSEANGGNGWVVRRERGQVLPWNLESKVDIAATSEKFIMRMVRDCSYLMGEKALPKESLLYQRYCVLNEINNIKINGENISVELKQSIYNELFRKGKRITRKALCSYLSNRGLLQDEAQLSGVDTNLNNYLSSYGKFLPVFGEKLELDSVKNMVERIIYLSTIYGDSKRFLQEVLKKEFGDILDEKSMKRILGLRFKDWGNLSREFLELEGTDETGESVSLIGTMWDTNYNMMELINSEDYGFRQSLEEKGNSATKLLEEFQAEDLEEYYFSAPTRRMIWQTIKIIQELTEVLGEYPARVFIEMTRTEGEKGDAGRKDSRKKRFLELYKSVKNETQDWAKIIEDADESGRLKSKKMYLYLTQMGKCMYSGDQIDLDRLFTPDYDIDHIYPRSQVKDDNLDNNLALVKKYYNAEIKKDIYPLDKSIQDNEKVRNLWRLLKDKNLITEEKYKRLTGTNPFTDEQRADFIARQLVETSQGTKGLADFLKQLFPKTTKIVYAKAGNVSDFRRDNDMLKCRVVNDFHHAQDAYLNIVVGNVYYTKFTQDVRNFIKKEYARDKEAYGYNLAKMYAKNITRNGVTAWVAEKDGKGGTIETVRAMMAKNTPLMTRMSFAGQGGIANETLYSASAAKGEGYIPFKTSDSKLSNVTRYGGFSKVSIAYFFLVEHEDKKGNRIRTIETVPVYLREQVERDGEALLQYCREDLGLRNPSVRLSRINIQALLKINGYFMYISGKTSKRYELKNAVNMKLPYVWTKYIRTIDKGFNNNQKGMDDDGEITREKNVELYDILCQKYAKGVFSKRPNPVGKKLVDGRDKFCALFLQEQCKVILEIMKLNVIGNTTADLLLIEQTANMGKLRINKQISDIKEILLINQSVTGIYERYIDLLTV